MKKEIVALIALIALFMTVVALFIVPLLSENQVALLAAVISGGASLTAWFLQDRP